MRVIVAGSRGITSYEAVAQAIETSGITITEVISGGARGVDTLGEEWGRNNGVPFRRFPAQWERYGKSAGYRRNEVMAREAEALIAIWDGESRGTKHMIDLAKKAGLVVYVQERE
jgi:hypothetical protein